jgi:hypothetical protein
MKRGHFGKPLDPQKKERVRMYVQEKEVKWWMK